MEENKDWSGNTQSVMATLNASNHSDKDRAKNDYYATPPESVEELLKREEFSDVWECACGEGHISEVLKNHNIHSLSSDLINRRYGLVEDFLITFTFVFFHSLKTPDFSRIYFGKVLFCLSF